MTCVVCYSQEGFIFISLFGLKQLLSTVSAWPRVEAVDQSQVAFRLQSNSNYAKLIDRCLEIIC